MARAWGSGGICLFVPHVGGICLFVPHVGGQGLFFTPPPPCWPAAPDGVGVLLSLPFPSPSSLLADENHVHVGYVCRTGLLRVMGAIVQEEPLCAP
eukprot:351270-Chlamydomonas_euryale.AAC.7